MSEALKVTAPDEEAKGMSKLTGEYLIEDMSEAERARAAAVDQEARPRLRRSLAHGVFVGLGAPTRRGVEDEV